MTPTSDDSHLKIDLAHAILPESFKCTTVFKLKIAEVKIELCYQGPFLDETLDFLKAYFINFETFTGLADAKIYYWQLSGKFGDKDWTCWNSWTHEIDFQIFNEEFDVLIARDFVAKIDKSGNNIYAHGPIWSFETCDSIDNIISYILGRKLIQYNGFILHAATVVKNDEAYVFFGASGAGKSTLASNCFEINNLSVISSDQVIIKFAGDDIIAQVMPTTIPEFPLTHPAREIRAIKVKCMLHLVQKPGLEFTFQIMESTDWVFLLMRELVYRNEFSNAQDILDLALKMAKKSDIIKGEISYKKGTNFFNQLEAALASMGQK